jgi:rubredoxin
VKDASNEYWICPYCGSTVYRSVLSKEEFESIKRKHEDYDREKKLV